MEKKTAIRAICVVVILLALGGIYSIVNNAVCYVDVPDVKGMTVTDAVRACEEEGIPDESFFRVVDKDKVDAVIDAGAWKDYQVVEQSHEPGDRFNVKGSLFSGSSRVTDLMEFKAERK